VDNEMQIPAHFFRHAWREALRYGDDDWVFVRELIQNARDAHATEIRLDVDTSDHLEQLVCADDGTGMDEATIRDHLTRLFSSTKNGEREGTIGKFGVGFWSILRFRPSEIVVDSVHATGRHALTIDVVHRRAWPTASVRDRRGTTIRLTRPRGSDAPHALVDVLRARVRHYAGPVSGLPGQPAPSLVVAGARMNEAMALAGFVHRPISGRGFQGSIALTSAPSIRLYARGLLVREASTLEEILPRRRVATREGLPGLHMSSAVNADDLEVLLDRHHVVESPTLERIVDGIDRSAKHLQRDVLERLAPLPALGRARAALLRRETGVAVGLLLAFGCAGLLGARIAEGSLHATAPVHHQTASAAQPLGTAAVHVESPRIDTAADASLPPWAFRYQGPDGLLFKVGTLADDDDARGLLSNKPRGVGPYRFAHAGDQEGQARERTAVVTVAEGPHALILPVPTGHRLVQGSVVVDGVPIGLVEETIHDEPVIDLAPGPHEVAYETVRDEKSRPPSRAALDTLARAPRALPEVFARRVDELLGTSVDTRIRALSALVREHVRYTTDPLDATLFARSTLPFLERVARFGTGDCDVQNGTLVLLLRSAGIPARLAVGLVGGDGRVARDFHAWAEAFDGDTWRVIDISPVRPRVDATPASVTAIAATTTNQAKPLTPSRQSTPSPSATPTSADTTEFSSTSVDAQTSREGSPAPVASSSSQRDFEIVGARVFRGPGPILATGLMLVLLALAAVYWHRRLVKIDDEAAARMTEALLARAATVAAGQHDKLALRRRRLLPTTRQRRVSLDEVDAALAASRACVSIAASEASVPLPKGAIVLDGTSPMVRRLVETHPGLVDLDRVARALSSTAPTAVVRVEQALAAFVPKARILLIDGVGVGILAFDDREQSTLATLGRDAPALRRALEEHDVAVAAFLIAEHLFTRTTRFFEIKDEVLTALAREVLP
jgi:transglutaminase-like putative cysteine protease